jgi:hypothetical protein
MSRDRLKHSLDELFSDFSPPTPEVEAEPSHAPFGDDARTGEDTPKEPTPPEQSHDAVESLPEKEAPSEQRENGDEGEVVSQEDDSSPEDNISTWRAGWRDLASENMDGQGRADSARRSIGIRRRRLVNGGREQEKGSHE